MAVGTFRSTTLDVGDLPVAERFWSEVLGLEVQFSAWQGQYSRVGRKGEPSVLLQLVPEPKSATKNRAHVDVTVDDVEAAVRQVVELGGAVVKPPAPYPAERPWIEWAVLTDPSGNEFCVVRELRPTL